MDKRLRDAAQFLNIQPINGGKEVKGKRIKCKFKWRPPFLLPDIRSIGGRFGFKH